jgi:predicted DCC family thiol-disulfide oxidoreductase YuxK
MDRKSNHSAGPSTGDGEPPSVGAAGEILLVYDWECPACDTYCRRVRVRPSAGKLHLVNARETTASMEEITKAGLDIDQGMVVKMGGRLYYGSDAIHALAVVSSPSDLFNRLSHYVFRSKTLSRILYPGLRACRNLLLKAMGKTKINNLSIEGNDRF